MKKRHIEETKKLDLAVFEKELRTMVKEGGFDLKIDEDFDVALDEIEAEELTSSELKRFYQTVKKASHERALFEGRRKVSKANLPFGRHLQLIRDKSGLSQAEVAKLLNKQVAYIEKVENGQINPLKILVGDLADIMQLFRLTITELKATIKAFLDLSDAKTARINAMARTSSTPGTREKGDSIAHAVDAALQVINKSKSETKETKNEVKIDQEYLESIEKVLKERGEANLLV